MVKPPMPPDFRVYCSWILVSCSLIFSACNKRQPTSIEKMVASAEDIVKGPQDWEKNASLLVDFQKAAEEAGVSENDVVREFESSARRLVTFGTTWTRVARQQELNEYHQLTVAAVGKIRASANPVDGHVDAVAEIGESSKKILELISRSLDGSESKAFEDAWFTALEAFRNLYRSFRAGRQA